MSEVSEEVISWYKRKRYAQSCGFAYSDIIAVADALRDERAKRLKAEFLIRVWQDTFVHDNKPGNLCECRWTFPDWQALAHKQFLGE